MRPMGIFWRLEGRFSKVDDELGKIVERVPSGVRWRMRRARMALSRDVGMRFVDSVEDGLLITFSGEEMAIGMDELLVS